MRLENTDSIPKIQGGKHHERITNFPKQRFASGGGESTTNLTRMGNGFPRSPLILLATPGICI